MRLELHFSDGLAELARAAASGDEERVAELITYQKLNPNALSDEGMPLLLWPVHHKNPAGFQALLKNGADPNVRAGNGELALHYIVEGGDASMLRAALAHGADPEAVNRDREPLIHIARRVRKWDMIDALLDHGANIDAFEGGLHGNTVLSVVTGFGDFEHAHALLERGADPTFALKQAPKPERVGAQPILEDIFYRPVDAEAYPEISEWQRKCQALVRAAGIEPPPPPRRYR